ncbi:MAG: DUF4125 family protein, partial [Lachnospiraceae bacterium]|nr:DUF4125 family protein [Lachnospiraceae bacterium]
LFEENRPKEAEMFMLEMLGRARMTEDILLELQMLNELIGYYRQTGERERLEAVIERSLDLAGLPELINRDGGRLSFATTLLNAANGYRSIGELDKSETLYGEVEEIYKELLPEEDMLHAGLHNNISLLYQEKKQYSRAKEHLLRALNIVTANSAGFETAVTYANLANTSIIEATELAMSNDETKAAKVFLEAGEYAAEAIKRFEARNTIDAHYCAALSALGMCKYNDGHFFEARDLFLKAMEIVERTIGRNGQYDRLKENFEICDKKCMNGQKLSKLYFEQIGLPMLKEKFPDYISKMAVGLVGKGSDCFGFDDFTSMDHDWGPDFCIWVSDETYEEIGDDLTKAYEALPGEFMGYKRTTTAHGKGRRGVFTVSGFFKDLLGASSYSDIDWRNVPDYSLAAAVNGEIYFDNEGTFSKIRSELMKGYPEDIKYLKIAEMMAKSSQAGQYNYPRMLKRGDRLTADIMLTDSIKYLLVLAHYTEGKYPPHDKWLYRSFCKLNCAVELKPIIDSLHASFSMNDKEVLNYVNQTWDKAGDLIAAKLYAEDLISDVTNYLDYHSDELVKKAEYSKLNDEELVRLIAKTEFAAFDKVKNEGGRASCQNDWPTFCVMRKSQYKTWDRTMLIQYLYDFNREMSYGHNLITEKYGRMMESTAPDKYSELKHHFPALSEDKKKIIEQIVAVQMSMLEDFALKHPLLADNARSFYTDDDNFNNTSYETYLRGEISTYSDKMLQLYGRYVVRCLQEEKNIAEMIIMNTARLYGYDSLEAFENAGKS